MALRIQQPQCTADQHAVDVGVDLSEVGRLEGHADAKVWQLVRQLKRRHTVHAVGVEQLNRVGAFGLQPPLHAGVGGHKRTQAVFVRRAQGVKMAQHQCGHVVTAGQFNLGAGVACVHARNQRPQWQQHGADMGRQYGAYRHVGHVAALALVKPDQHRAFFDDMAHRQPGPVAVTPCGALYGPPQRIGLDFAQVPQVVLQHTLFHGHLRGGIQVLHLAAATRPGVQAKVRATRCDAL